MDEGTLFVEINKSKTFKLDKDHTTCILLNQWLVGGECWWVYTPVQICHVPHRKSFPTILKHQVNQL